MNVHYCKIAKNEEVEQKINEMIEGGRFIKTKETARYIYGKCALGNCTFCEEYKNPDYYKLTITVIDENGEEQTIEFEPRFAGENDGT